MRTSLLLCRAACSPLRFLGQCAILCWTQSNARSLRSYERKKKKQNEYTAYLTRIIKFHLIVCKDTGLNLFVDLLGRLYKSLFNVFRGFGRCLHKQRNVVLLSKPFGFFSRHLSFVTLQITLVSDQHDCCIRIRVLPDVFDLCESSTQIRVCSCSTVPASHVGMWLNDSRLRARSMRNELLHHEFLDLCTWIYHKLKAESGWLGYIVLSG